MPSKLAFIHLQKKHHVSADHKRDHSCLSIHSFRVGGHTSGAQGSSRLSAQEHDSRRR